MGMFDRPVYLTGKDGYVEPGDTFWLHNARIEGVSNLNGESKPLAKLKVSRERGGDTYIVFTSGTGITGQIARMEQSDRDMFPMEVRLDAIPSKTAGRSATHVITPASQEVPVAATDEPLPF